MIREPADYAARWRAGGPAGPVEGLAGRVLKGRRRGDFRSLSDDPARRLVLLMGADGLARLLDSAGRDRLRLLGYPAAYVDELEADGYQFELVVFPERPQDLLATWENLGRIVSQVMPEAGARLAPRLAELEATPFAALQAQAPWSMAEVYRAGRADPRFQDAARFARSAGEAWRARAFLFHELHLNELFAGDGWVRDAAGQRTMRELVGEAVPLDALPQLERAALELRVSGPRA